MSISEETAALLDTFAAAALTGILAAAGPSVVRDLTDAPFRKMVAAAAYFAAFAMVERRARTEALLKGEP